MKKPREVSLSTARARRLRKRSTRAEHTAWQLLRNRNVLNLKFRRQHPLFGYIVDFYCHELKLALELDGRHHAKPLQRKKDEARDAFLEARGITIIRIKNEDLTHDRLRGIIDPYCHARRNRPLRDSRIRLDSENGSGSE